jgi:hypothetical protein
VTPAVAPGDGADDLRNLVNLLCKADSLAFNVVKAALPKDYERLRELLEAKMPRGLDRLIENLLTINDEIGR